MIIELNLPLDVGSLYICILGIFCIRMLLEWCLVGECWLRGAVQAIKVRGETKKNVNEDFSELGCPTTFSTRIDAVKIEEDFSSDLSESEERG